MSSSRIATEVNIPHRQNMYILNAHIFLTFHRTGLKVCMIYIYSRDNIYVYPDPAFFHVHYIEPVEYIEMFGVYQHLASWFVFQETK